MNFRKIRGVVVFRLNKEQFDSKVIKELFFPSIFYLAWLMCTAISVHFSNLAVVVVLSNSYLAIFGVKNLISG